MDEDKLIDALTLEQYFKKHPDEEREFLEEMERLRFHNEQLDFPDHEFIEGASYAID